MAEKEPVVTVAWEMLVRVEERSVVVTVGVRLAVKMTVMWSPRAEGAPPVGGLGSLDQANTVDALI